MITTETISPRIYHSKQYCWSCFYKQVHVRQKLRFGWPNNHEQVQSTIHGVS